MVCSPPPPPSSHLSLSVRLVFPEPSLVSSAKRRPCTMSGPIRYHPYHHYPSPSYPYPMNMPYFPPPHVPIHYPQDHAQIADSPPLTSSTHSSSNQQTADSCLPAPQSQAGLSTASQRSYASASIPVSSYRPERSPTSAAAAAARKSTSPDSQPRSAADVYVESRQPKTTAGNKILATLAGDCYCLH